MTTSKTMKNRLYIQLFLLLGICALVSCRTEIDDYFDSSASQRIENEILKYRELLSSPQYGWAMEYFPGGTNQAFGGYALAVSFSQDGYATFLSSLSDDVGKSVTSLYSLKKDMGATLNFDTYNELFHYFSDSDISDGDGQGKGLLGDYEFILHSATESEIVMYGKKHGSAIHMYALQEPAEAYLQKAKENRMSYQNIAAVCGLKGTFAGKPVTGDVITSQYFMLTQGDKQTKFSFMFTDKGVRLYAPIELDGQRVEKLVWNADEKTFSSPDGTTRLELIADPLGLREEQLLGEYALSYTGKKTDVSISKQPNGGILMKGLPFDVRLTYNSKKGALELNSQQLKTSPDIRLAIWCSQLGNLTWGTGYGLTTRWNGDDENFVLELVDNGYEWFVGGKRIYADAFILWNTAGGEYKGYGDSRFQNLKLTKKK